MLGLGVMIGMLGGNEGTAEACRSILGKTLTKVKMENDTLSLTVEGGQTLNLRDEGHSCCESRYMTCDDDLSSFVGGTVVDIELREAPENSEDEYGECHDVQFLVVKTTQGEIVAQTHNEHNGYYGGFYITASVS